MSTGKGQVVELILEDGCRHARISCPPNLIPSPGQYLLAGDASDGPLPVPLFYTDSAAESVAVPSRGHFIGAAPVPASWHPGLELYLRGPLGRGFTLPLSAVRVGLIAFDRSPARLMGLIRPALKQDAAVVLVCETSPDNLPDDVEVHPVSSVQEILAWADYVAIDARRENLPELREQLGKLNQLSAGKARVEVGRKEVQILLHTPIPCGGIADCGVCAVSLKSEWKLACKDGPVFEGRDILQDPSRI